MTPSLIVEPWRTDIQVASHMKSDHLYNFMTSLADYLQDLVLSSSWAGIWRGGQAWRNRLEGPALQDLHDVEEQEELLTRKLALCSVTYNFSCSTTSKEEEKDREKKTATLEELLDFAQLHFQRLSRAVLSDLVEMVAANIFRALPRPTVSSIIEDEEEWQDPAWTHLRIVYKLFLSVLEQPDFDPSVLKNVINRQFVNNVLDLFRSSDEGEREFLKTVLHRMYGNFLSLRSFIRLRMAELLLSLVHDNDDLPGTGELLEVISAILGGVALPLRAEHLSLAERVLVPLHRIPSYHSFSPQLSHCCCLIVTLQSSLLEPFLRGLLRYWPRTDSSKELLFLGEMDQLLTTITSLPASLIEPLLTQVSKSCSSTHSRVAERALHLSTCHTFLTLVEIAPRLVRRVLVAAIVGNVVDHWSPTVAVLSQTVSEEILVRLKTRRKGNNDHEYMDEMLVIEEMLDHNDNSVLYVEPKLHNPD